MVRWILASLLILMGWPGLLPASSGNSAVSDTTRVTILVDGMMKSRSGST